MTKYKAQKPGKLTGNGGHVHLEIIESNWRRCVEKKERERERDECDREGDSEWEERLKEPFKDWDSDDDLWLRINVDFSLNLLVIAAAQSSVNLTQRELLDCVIKFVTILDIISKVIDRDLEFLIRVLH